MYFIEEDCYTCPLCGCVFNREELKNPPDFTNAIIERNNVQCLYCGEFGMNYQTKGKPKYMVGYRLQETKK